MKKIDKYKLSITREELLMLKNIISIYSSVQDSIIKLLQEDKSEYEISVSLGQSISETLTEQVSLINRYNLIGTNTNNELEDRLYSLLKEYIDSEGLLVRDEELKINESIIAKVNEIVSVNNELYLLRDYRKAFNNLMKDLKYFCDSEVIEDISNRYKDCLKRSATKELHEVLTDAQKLIIDYWKKYLSDPNTYKEKTPYNFLCHSTSTTSYEGGFNTKYVSCSLLCDELTDTYRQGYGFIMPADNIIAANSEDMYVINSARNDNELLNYSTIKKISSPDRVKQEALELKNLSRQSKNKGKVYTEIVVKGFNPIAIFYLDDGSKTLNRDYVQALKLQESFPHLKVISLDNLKCKTVEELYDIRAKIINSIILRLRNTLPTDQNYYHNFDMFWHKYLELIKSDNYSETDIINLYTENYDYISIFFDLSKLFDNIYDLETIRYILYYNYQTRIIDIINGQANDVILDRLYKKLIKYKDNKILEAAVPNISLFLKLYPNVEFSADDKVGLEKCNSIESINNFLMTLLSKEKEKSRYEQENIIEELFKDNISYMKLEDFYNSLKKLYEEGRIDTDNNDLMLFLKLYPLAVIDQQLLDDLSQIKINDFNSLNDCLLKSLSRKRETLKQKFNKYQCRLDLLLARQKEKENLIISFETAKKIISYQDLYLLYKRDMDYILNKKSEAEKSLREINQDLDSQVENYNESKQQKERLNNHRFLNRHKVKKIDIELARSEVIIADKNSIAKKIKHELSQLQTEISFIKESFRESTNIDYDEYESKLQEALTIVSDIDITKEKSELLSVNNTIELVRKKVEFYRNETDTYLSVENEFKK